MMGFVHMDGSSEKGLASMLRKRGVV